MRDAVRIKVKLFATLTRFGPAGRDEFDLDLPTAATVGQALARLGLPAEVERVALVGGRLSAEDRVLQAGEELVLFPPVEGG
jgi:molybdopterin converting factor small subunit